MIDPEQTTTHVIPGPPKSLEFLPAGEAGDIEDLVALLAEEMTQAWRHGKRPCAEDFLDRHPNLWNLPAAVMDLLYEEICLRQEYKEPLDLDDMVRRFPARKEQIEILLHCAQALETGGMGGFPVAGETVGDFLLLSEIGRGALGRVFVATQSSLGDRPVVLKITPRGGREHLSLARLQHTHIVPLLSVLDEPDRNLRVLCMPYFGGLTLAAILDGIKEPAPQRRTGQHILDVLDEARAAAVLALPPGRDPATLFLSRASYVQAFCWLGACLAEALKYAHERGLVHLDLKPSNVLLTADRQPMLLDFHLAQEPLKPGDLGMRFGGTPAYMSPEQKKAMAAIRKGDTLTQAIDGRSDIYSLGLVLYEALSGPIPRGAGFQTPLHQSNSQVSPGLSDIIAKCLSPQAKDRYPDAGALAADLWGHLNDQPLKGVANRSLPERWRKWRRRKPHMLSLFGMLAAVFMVAAVAISFAFVNAGHREDEARLALADGQKHIKNAQYADAVTTLQRGLSQLESLPGNWDLKEQLTTRLQLASRAQVAQELHKIADSIRFLYGGDEYPSAKLSALEAHCRAFWDKRHLIMDRLGKELEPALEQRVQLDLLDLAILGSNLRVRLAKPYQAEAARREALQVLDEAETLFGPSKVLYHERRLHAEALGEVDLARAAQERAAQSSPRTAWEFYALGRSLLLAGNPKDAAPLLDQAVQKEPGLWPNFYQGICNYRLGRFLEASVAFTTCTALAPQSAGCFYNRALAYVGLDRPDLALPDFDRALKLDPEFAEAARNRDMVHQKEEQKEGGR